MHRLLAAALLAVAVPQLVLARPAVVRVFEAAARAEPSGSAAVLHLFSEKAELSVSEELQDGWRRVRLPDGSVGWIEERALAFPGATATSSPTAPVPAAVRSDATVSPRAEALRRRRNTSIGIWVAGGIAAVALAGASAARQMPDPGDPRFGDTLDGKSRMLMGGVMVSIATGLLGLAIYPRRGELLDVVNAWNTGHPDQQFEVGPGEIGRR